ncbi:hypothetical protein GPECTOR_1g417 [Gonium pectorale]|uniref:WD repeat-containing protein 60 n=1 Tax=Gonium pectorale TaxID=33097 RepID=A0A150H2R2_GONPE|nr:hypothetical protein GPECTOR_1g417 [Gonium pectorale]|eukprot:KXZ56466.1 hypothetical protein GPECTOR_1g417 [Gonium pectorale]
MSDYEDEDFENYDDDDFEAAAEEDEEDDYDVLPTKSATPQSTTPKEVASPTRGAPVRTSYTGRPPSAGGHGPSNLSRTTASVSIPAFAGLTDAQRKAAKKKLAGAIQRIKKISLQVVVMDDFPQLQSLSKYELYNMGRSQYAGLKVASAQTHEDDKDEEMQTDEIDTRGYSCQVPEDRNTPFEGEHTLSAGGVVAASSGPAITPANRLVMRITAMAPDQESKLLAFMRWAGPIMLAALGMNPTAKKLAISAGKDPKDAALSAGSVKLGHAQEALLSQRPVTGLAFCPGPSPLLLASYAPVGAQLGAAALLQDHSLNSKGVLAVWDLSAPSSPASVLVSEGSPSCCCWAPAPHTNMVFAGMEEGGVCAWDLEEPDSRHPLEVVGGVGMFTRRPSYTTEYLADVATTAAPIVGITTTPRTESRSRPCQVVSLNGWGTVTVYTVVLLAPAEKNAADADIGLRPGSHLKLVRTTQLTRLGMRTLRPILAKPGGGMLAGVQAGEPAKLDQLVQTFSLQVLSGPDMDLLAGSDAGKVLRGSLVGVPPAPKEYIPDDHRSAVATRPSARPVPSCVTCLHASPFVPIAFVSGHSNGTVALHGLHGGAAAAVWPDVTRGKVLVVRWSPVRPAVFYALDSLCTVFTFDLAASRTAPVAAQSFMLKDKGKQMASLPTYFDIGMVNTGEEKGKAVSTPCFCVGYDDGLLDVNLLSQKQATPVEGEQQLLEELVRTVMDKGKAK